MDLRELVVIHLAASRGHACIESLPIGNQYPEVIHLLPAGEWKRDPLKPRPRKNFKTYTLCTRTYQLTASECRADELRVGHQGVCEQCITQYKNYLSYSLDEGMKRE